MRYAFIAFQLNQFSLTKFLCMRNLCMESGLKFICSEEDFEFSSAGLLRDIITGQVPELA